MDAAHIITGHRLSCWEPPRIVYMVHLIVFKNVIDTITM